jgi:TatD DNase family protein
MVDFIHKKISENRNKILCIGECGLDYFYTPNDDEKKLQLDVFSAQLDIALIENLPVMVHTRMDNGDTYNLLKSFASKGGRGVIHCFTGTTEDAKKYLDLGFYISASGIITFKKSDELRLSFVNVPLDRLLIETDAPYLAPVPFRGKSNEPAFVKFVAEKLAEIKNTSFDEIAKSTTENFQRLYGIKKDML